jgi:AraC family carnitine catabolism transcriptional activator
MSIDAAAPEERNRRGELVLLLASWGAETYQNREALSWLRRQSREGARLCPVENGAWLMARAGLLAGRETAVHWAWAPGFQEQFGAVQVIERLYTREPLSSAGGLSGTDLMLELIAERHGQALAGEIADQMLHPGARPPNAAQRRTQAKDGLPPAVARAVALIEANIAEPLPVPEIAEALGLSQRQLERQFRQALGCTVVQFATLARLQHARVLLISTKLSVRDIAAASGFGTLSHFAHAFHRHFNRRPSDYRQGWPQDAPTPSWPGTLAAFLEARRQQTTGRGD